MRRAIVDNNVLVVANGDASHASTRCEQNCIKYLLKLKTEGRIVLDNDKHILSEYIKHFSKATSNKPGSAFYRWVIKNLKNPLCCERHHVIAPIPNTGSFQEFPADPALANFDLSDRKFVALAKVANAPVWNAVDKRSWWDYREALQTNGIQVEFLCPEQFAEGR